MRNSIWGALALVAVFASGIQLGKNAATETTIITNLEKVEALEKKLAIYADHYVCSEHLLDLIDKKYHWADGIDHQGYYETKAEVEHCDSIEIAASKLQFQKILDWENSQNK